MCIKRHIFHDTINLFPLACMTEPNPGAYAMSTILHPGSRQVGVISLQGAKDVRQLPLGLLSTIVSHLRHERSKSRCFSSCLLKLIYRIYHCDIYCVGFTLCWRHRRRKEEVQTARGHTVTVQTALCIVVTGHNYISNIIYYIDVLIYIPMCPRCPSQEKKINRNFDRFAHRI